MAKSVFHSKLDMVPPKGRARVHEVDDSINVEIPPSGKTGVVVVLVVFPVIWAVGLVEFYQEFLSGTGLFAVWMLFWLIIWFSAGLVFGIWLVWGGFSTEVISVSDGMLTVGRRLGRFRRDKVYSSEKIRNFRAIPFHVMHSLTEEENRQNGVAYMSVLFDFGKRTYGFGHNLDEAEARYLIDRIHPWIDAS